MQLDATLRVFKDWSFIISRLEAKVDGRVQVEELGAKADPSVLRELPRVPWPSLRQASQCQPEAELARRLVKTLAAQGIGGLDSRFP